MPEDSKTTQQTDLVDNLVDAARQTTTATKTTTDTTTQTKPGLAFGYDEKAFETVFGKPGDDGRPANVPDKYWDKEKKSVKADVVFSQLRWAEAKIGKPIVILGAPSAEEKYDIALPKDFTGLVELDEADPRLQGFLDIARKHDLNQGFVSEVLATVAAKVRDGAAENLKAEVARLGDKGPQRLKDMADMLDAQLGPEQSAMMQLMFQSAPVFEAFETLVNKLGPPKFADKDDLANTVNERAQLQEEWREKYFAKDERGQRKVAVDDNYRREVEALRDRAFGTTRRDASGRPVNAGAGA